MTLEFPQDHLDWLQWEGWDSLAYQIRSYEDRWIWEVMRWYRLANSSARTWHRLETIETRRAAINLTVNNVGSKPATYTVIEAKIYGDNKQTLHYSDQFTWNRDKEISTFGNNVEYEQDWSLHLIRSRCDLTDKNEIREFQLSGFSDEVININKPVWYAKPQRVFKVYDLKNNFSASIASVDNGKVLQFRCEIPEIVHFESADCPGFDINSFYQKIKNVTIEYRVHSRDQKKPTIGKIVIDVVEFEPNCGGSEPWINPIEPLKYFSRRI